MRLLVFLTSMENFLKIYERMVNLGNNMLTLTTPITNEIKI